MPRDRVGLFVMVDLDPIPGAFHTAKQAEEAVQAILLNAIPHYAPVVVLEQ